MGANGSTNSLLQSRYGFLFDSSAALEQYDFDGFRSLVCTKIEPVIAQTQPVELLLPPNFFYICSKWIDVKGFKTVQYSFLLPCLKSEDVCFCRI